MAVFGVDYIYAWVASFGLYVSNNGGNKVATVTKRVHVDKKIRQ